MSGRPQMTEQSENQLSQLRLWSELFAVTTMFVIFSIILFSVQKDVPEDISFTISHWLFFAAGCLSLLFATIFGVLSFWTSKAKDLAYWLERSNTHPKRRVAFWEVFWPFVLGWSKPDLCCCSGRRLQSIARLLASYCSRRWLTPVYSNSC